MSEQTRPPTEENRLYGAFGLAVLVANVATVRAYGFGAGCRIRLGDPESGPLDRVGAEGWPASSRYYEICDRIARGQPI